MADCCSSDIHNSFIDPNAARRYLKYIFICVDAPREAEKG